MNVSDAKRLKELEAENVLLKLAIREHNERVAFLHFFTSVFFKRYRP
jgi:hypothetical protein